MKYLSLSPFFIMFLSIISYGQIPPAPAPSDQVEPNPSDRHSVTARSYVSKDEPAKITRFAKPPVIDAVLNEEEWQQAAAFGNFRQTQPGDNIEPSDLSEVLIGYDAKNLYLAFRIKE